MSVRVSGGRLILGEEILSADVVCEKGSIVAILEPEAGFAADEDVDATGCVVFPGFIDPHVHSRDPGLTHKEDFAHSTLSALAGGITTVLEMPNAVPPVDTREALELRAVHLAQAAWTDFGLWGIALGDGNIGEIAGMFEAGAVGVKLFWGYALHRDTRTLVYDISAESPSKLLMPPDNAAVLRLFAEVARCGGVLAAHCEDRGLLDGGASAVGHPVLSYDDLLTARPDTAEAVAISVGAELSAATGCRFHVVHLASAAGLSAVRAAQRRGISLTAETCPHYLTLTDADFPRLGPLMKVFPPVRRQADQEALWAGLNDGTICSVGSDHAPHTTEEKAGALAGVPAGFVGTQTLAPILIDALIRGRITPKRLARVLSTDTAKLFGLYPKKGVIAVGSDADLTIVDPTVTRTIRNEDLHSKHPISPWHGLELRGAPVAALLRGEVVMRDGAGVGKPSGRFVTAAPVAREDVLTDAGS